MELLELLTPFIEAVLEPILTVLFVTIGYVVGFLPVFVFTLCAIAPGPIEAIDDRAYYRSKGMKWWHLTYVEKGIRFLPAGGVVIVGWLLIGSFAGLVWLLLTSLS